MQPGLLALTATDQSRHGDVLLSVRGLKTYFPLGQGWTGSREVVRAVDGVDFDLRRGEVLGLVGESGSGKTTLGRSVTRLVEPTAGGIRFDGGDFRRLTGKELRRTRRRLQIVFQDPYASLSPRMQIGQIVAEPLKLHRLVPPSQTKERVLELLGRVGIEPYFIYRYPHEMSGGQRQRIAIARALALQPELIVADEPVSALDVSVQAQILKIFLGLKRTDGIAMLFVSSGGAHRGPHLGDVPRPVRGAGANGSADSVTSSPLYEGAPCRGSRGRRRREATARPSERRAAQGDRGAARLPFCEPLSPSRAGMPRRHPTARAESARA
jgi:ABC-type dipeptide/oligopeptide/nickel transport system ATPase subunit